MGSLSAGHGRRRGGGSVGRADEHPQALASGRVDARMKWLITGVAGFIGSNLGHHLLSAGDSVVGIDDFSTGTRRNADRLLRLGGERFHFFEGTILDAALVGRAMDVDAVVHLAAQVSVQRSFEDPAHTNAVNVEGFLNVHRAAAAAGVPRLVYASSCAVYGDNPALPLDEESETRPLSPYAASKLADELYAEALRPARPGTDVVGLRFFNVYGPWQDHRGGYAAVIPRWIDASLRGERPIIFGDGAATRDFCYVGDVAAAVERVGRGGVAGTHRIFNVATGLATSLSQLHAAIASTLAARGVPLPAEGPERRPWRSGDILHSRGSNERLRREIGVSATIGLDVGIGRLLEEQHGLAPPSA
jgi:UDP-N-acetylglucosamine/UDP-N-acetylgalactosamine 4-epimerase